MAIQDKLIDAADGERNGGGCSLARLHRPKQIGVTQQQVPYVQFVNADWSRGRQSPEWNGEVDLHDDARHDQRPAPSLAGRDQEHALAVAVGRRVEMGRTIHVALAGGAGAWRASLSPRAVVATTVLLAGLAAEPPAADAAGPMLAPSGPPYTVAGDFAPGPALDISGIACLPATGPVLRCLVINDEGHDAQFATIEGRRLVPGGLVPLLGGTPVGTPTTAHQCAGLGKAGDLDGEGVAFAAPYFYVVGSHGCSRKQGKFRSSSFILARVDVGAAGEAFDSGHVTVETTYRLADALRAQPKLAPFFAAPLDAAHDGLNIEGVAILGNRLYAGLRAPALDGDAVLVGADIAGLFAPGGAALPHADAAPDLVTIHLGPHLGIRDLAALPDGRLLVLAGPAQEQDLPYSLFTVDPGTGTAQAVGTLAQGPGSDRAGKAEAVTVLPGGKVLVLFDSLPNGGARDYLLPSR